MSGSRDAHGAAHRTKQLARVPLNWARRTLAGSDAWRLWRARNLERRAIGPLDGPNEWSVIAAPPSADNGPSDELVDFAVRAINAARSADLKTLRERRPKDASRLDR